MRLDPRSKLLILLFTSVSVFLNGLVEAEIVLVACSALLLSCSGKILTAARFLGLFGILMAVQFVLVPVLPLMAGGVLFIFTTYIRKLIPCFMLGSLLVSTTKVSQFLAALHRMRLPKGPTISMSITLRYFPTMKEEWRAIREAMSLRGLPATPVGMACHPVKSMEYVYVPMLISASRISDEIAQAAVTRGIDHIRRRTCIEQVGFTFQDVLVLAVYLGVLAWMAFANGAGAL